MAMNHDVGGSSAMSMATSAVMNMASATTGMNMASSTAGMAGMSGMAPSSTAKPAMSMGGMGNGCKISVRSILFLTLVTYCDAGLILTILIDRCYGTGTQLTLASSLHPGKSSPQA